MKTVSDSKEILKTQYTQLKKDFNVFKTKKKITIKQMLETICQYQDYSFFNEEQAANLRNNNSTELTEKIIKLEQEIKKLNKLLLEKEI